MKCLGLDISTKAGWAVLSQKEDGSVVFERSGLLTNDRTALEFGAYPKGYRLAAENLGRQLADLVRAHRPDVVIVEETNQGKNRYTQKLLEWIHLSFQQHWDGAWDDSTWPTVPEPKYISTGTWKHTLGLKKPKDAKQNDVLLKQAKAMAATGACTLNEAKKKLGVRGKWNKKMLAVNHVNERFNLGWKLKHNDEAEAICLVLAYLEGAPLCDGDPRPKKEDQ
jgi:hypothetical protein